MQTDPSGHWPKWLDKTVKSVAKTVTKAAKATANFVQENAAVIGAAVGLAAAAVVMVVTAPVSVPAMLGTLAVSAGVALVCAGVGGTVQTNYEAEKQSKKVDAYVEECDEIAKEEEKLEAEIRAAVESDTPITQAKKDEMLERAAVIEQRKIEAEVKRKNLCEEGERLQKQADLYQNVTYAGFGLTAMGFAPMSGPTIATAMTGNPVLASMPALGPASVSQITTGLAYTAGATEVLYAGSNIMELETGNNPIKEAFYDGDDEGDAAYEKDLETLNKINVASTLIGAASAVSSGISNHQNAKSQNSGSQKTTSQSTTSQSATSSGTSSGSTEIHNDVLDSPRTGSALTIDSENPIYEINVNNGRPQIVKEFPATAKAHGFSDIVDNYAGYATKTQLSNATLYQLDGSLNGISGRFEWIIQDGQVTHRMFVQNGTMNGVPIKP